MQPASGFLSRASGIPQPCGTRHLLAVAAIAVVLAAPAPLRAQDAARPTVESQTPSAPQDFGKLFDAIVSTTTKHFWDKDRLAAAGWEQRAAEVRPSIAEAPTPEEAARRINTLLGELKTSHTGLLTPDDVEYYILMSVFSGASMSQEDFDDRFWGAGVTYAGIGHFSAEIDGRRFVDAVLEGSPAARAGLQVGDELLKVDGAPYHPIRSFKGKSGREVQVVVRRMQGGPSQTIPIKAMTIAPLHAFREATRASARVIERDGRRIGYVHVWASVGEESANALRDALTRLGVNANGRSDRPPRLDGLIVDMRGKIGGTANTATRYLDLLDPRGPLLLGPREGNDASRAVRDRTAVLIDHHTRSTGELFVHAYKRERQGPLIGTRTAGAVSAARAFAMPGGNLLYIAVSGLEVDGDILEGPGVAPDIQMARPIPYAQGADPVLEAGVDALLAKAKRRQQKEPEAERANGP